MTEPTAAEIGTGQQLNRPFCAPTEHHLFAAVRVYAKLVLTPDEQTFEFFGDYAPSLQILDIECSECGFYVVEGGQVPETVRRLIEDSVMDAYVQEPLRP